MKKNVIVHHENDRQSVNNIEAVFEQMLIDKYLADKGYTLTGLKNLPPEEQKRILTEACQYASLKLTAIESTADLWAEVEG